MGVSTGSRGAPRHRESTRGAVYVEFLVAFMPLLIAFECLLQLAAVHIAGLVTAHAAQCAARAASVVLPDDPARYQGAPVGALEGQRLRDVEQAAAMPLRAVRGIVSARVSMGDEVFGQGAASPEATSSRRQLRVEVTYQCGIPIARRLVCDAVTGAAKLVAVAPVVVQAARYAYD